MSLGVWQIQRLHWKLDLIAQVNRQTSAVPVTAPQIATPANTYLHVTTHGIFLHDKEIPIRATTTAGTGYKIITPLQTEDGRTILINRGFVPPDNRTPKTRKEGQITGPKTITGLLRLTEPGGRLFRKNDPATNLWYSCDVAAIASARSLPETPLYYIDADATPNPGGLPIGGLTVINFPNNHLQYAITWFALALLLVVSLARFLWIEIKHKNPSSPPPACGRG
jgi:surfeit locus 1 family protein